MAHPSESNRYDRASVGFHWLTAVLVLLLWLMAQSEYLLPKEWRHGMWSIHIAVGGLLVLIYCARLVWRLSAGTRPTSVNSGALKSAEHIVHGLLYLILATTLAVGVANVTARGWDLFGLIQIPAYAAGDRALRRSINGWHELAANGLVVLAALHTFAALLHQFAMRDGLLRRMWFSRNGSRRSTPPSHERSQ